MPSRGQTDFVDVVLVQAGNKKNDVVMALREITAKEPVTPMLDLGRRNG